MANWWLLDQVFKTNCFSKLDDKFSEENKYMPVVATVIDVKKAGANGACIMSSIMLCDNVNKHLLEFKK